MPANWNSLPKEIQTQIIKEFLLLPSFIPTAPINRAIWGIEVSRSWEEMVRYLVPRVIPIKTLMENGKDDFTRDAIEVTVDQKERIVSQAGGKDGMSESERREFDQLVKKLSDDLQSVAERGFPCCVRMLLKRVPELAEIDGFGGVLLHQMAGLPHTAKDGNLEVLKLLLQEDWILGAIEELDMNGDTPLGAAMTGKQYGVLEVLLDHGADTTIRPSCLSRFPFHYKETGDCRLLTFATMMKDVELVKLLLARGFKPESEENSDEDGHVCIAIETRFQDILHLLLDHGANVKFDTSQRLQPIPSAMKRFIQTPIKLLLEKGADINACDHLGRDGLSVAIENRNAVEFFFLLERGAILRPKHLERCVVVKSLYFAEQIVDELGVVAAGTRGALHLACGRGDEEFVRFFLRRGIGPKSETPVPETSFLEAAVDSGSVECVELLIKYGANVNSTSGHSDGGPLSRSRRLVSGKITEILLAAGAIDDA
ncbi:hypothetical protein FQN54_003124 [Arachnomyces sp. PD_36]|nr:hypothetical protein FQN54_003124 [Arachnomyces sp. PD_36]